MHYRDRVASGTRIIIDLGHNLPHGAVKSEDEYDDPKNLKGLIKGISAVFYTHPHGDHIGFEARVAEERIPQYIGHIARLVLEALNEHMMMAKDSPDLVNKAKANMNALEHNFNEYKDEIPVTIGDITLTPYPVSHSACDSHMILIECDGKKVLHTGDFRGHGFISPALKPIIKRDVAPKGIDVLISEGTMLSRDMENVQTENDIEEKLEALFSGNEDDYGKKYVFAMTFSADPDRIADFYWATKTVDRERWFFVDHYQKKVLDIFTRELGSKSSHYRFTMAAEYNGRLNSKFIQSIQDNGFTFMIRPTEKFQKWIDELKNVIPFEKSVLIYSQFYGYIDKKFTSAFNKDTRAFIDRNWATGQREERHYHTSGHADMQTLSDVCNWVNPKTAIIPIHKNKDSDFKILSISEALKAKVVTESISKDGIDIIINNKP